MLTDNGIQFTNMAHHKYAFHHIFDRVCDEHGIEHRLTKIKHPWTNGQVERMNRTIKEATVKRYHYDSHDQLTAHLARLHRRLQFRPPTEDPQGPHALRIHLQMLDKRARTIQPKPAPSNAGTKHLGYRRFGAQGGDWGAAVTRALGHAHAGVVGAIHLNTLHVMADDVSPDCVAWQAEVDSRMMGEGAYAAIQATKPQTIGLALADSPVGHAGWVIEKCRTWSDCGGDVESVYANDARITNAMTNLVTSNVQSAIWMYNAMGADAFALRVIDAPVGFAEFTAEILPPPPRLTMSRSINIRCWTRMAKGGHFATWEQPQEFAQEVGAFFGEFH